MLTHPCSASVWLLVLCGTWVGCFLRPVQAGSSVVTVNSSTFASVVESTQQDPNSIWYVKFYAPWCGHCKALAPEWEKAAAALEGTPIHFAKADVDADGALGARFGIQGFPTIKIFFHPSLGKAPVEYDGGRKAKQIIAHARRTAGLPPVDEATDEEEEKETKEKDLYATSKHVVKIDSEEMFRREVLDDASFALVEFYAPWCGHCKALAPEWDEAAADLQRNGVPVKLCVVDATVLNTLSVTYKVNGFPTIVAFPPVNPTPTDENKKDPSQKRQHEHVEVGRNRIAIVDYVYKALASYGIRVSAAIHEITHTRGLEACVAAKYCVLLLLPHLVDTGEEGRVEYLETFGRVAGAFRGFPAAFHWICPVEQPDFESYFQLASGYPSMLIIDRTRGRYAKHVGRFDEDSLVRTIRNLQSGHHRVVFPLKREHGAKDGDVLLPRMVEVEPWQKK